MALRLSSYPKSLVEIIVVDNGSTTFPHTLIPELRTIVISEPKPGSYAARNTGFRHSRGDILAFTDADCLPSENWIRQGVACLLKGADRVAGQIETLPKRSPAGPADLYQIAFAFDVKADMEDKGQVATANFFVWRNVLQRVGEFNESAFSGADKEWGRRAKSLGIHTVFCPKAIISHDTRDFRALTQQRKRIAGGILLGRTRGGLYPSLASEFFRSRSAAIERLFSLEASLFAKLLAIGVGAWLLVVQAWWSLVFLSNTHARPPRA